MLVLLQCTVLTLLSLVVVVGIVACWLGLAPELDFFFFLKHSEVILPIFGVAAFLFSLIAYILGWNPTQRLLQRIRSSVVIPVFTSLVTLSTTTIVLIGLLATEATFLLSFSRPVAQEIISHLLAGDFAETDRRIAGSTLSSQRIADLTLVNDSLRQIHFKTTGDPDSDVCRVYLSYFSARRHAFQPVWWRYLYGHAIAACLEVTGNMNAAAARYRLNVQLARRLSVVETRRAWRRIAAFYLRDSGNQADIRNKTDRLNRVLAILATDPDITAKRMRGAAHYLLGNISEAVRVWAELLDSLPDSERMERKMLLNNSALGYAALKQYDRAMEFTGKGLDIGFANDNEAERREQIRLLATKAILNLQVGECAEARSAWNERRLLKEQDQSPCTALIGAQIMSCSSAQNEHEKITDLLIFATGLTATADVNPTEEVLTKLVDQAARKFTHCYSGLDFDVNSVIKAVSRRQTFQKPP